MGIQDIEAFIREQKSAPPLHLWNPELSGDMDMRIAANGDWFHEGDRIKRLELVKLFASILRREEDGEYYLLTPVEKWRIQVEDLPLHVIGFEYEQRRLALKLNTERWVWVDEEHSLNLQTGDVIEIPQLRLEHGLAARLSRNVFYQLVELGEERGEVLYLPLADSTDAVLGKL